MPDLGARASSPHHAAAAARILRELADAAKRIQSDPDREGAMRGAEDWIMEQALSAEAAEDRGPCRVCGCTGWYSRGKPCGWVEDDLCSRCAPESGDTEVCRVCGDPGVCRVCGCTEWDACIDPYWEPCCWVEDDLCSACAPESEEPEVHAMLCGSPPKDPETQQALKDLVQAAARVLVSQPAEGARDAV